MSVEIQVDPHVGKEFKFEDVRVGDTLKVVIPNNAPVYVLVRNNYSGPDQTRIKAFRLDSGSEWDLIPKEFVSPNRVVKVNARLLVSE